MGYERETLALRIAANTAWGTTWALLLGFLALFLLVEHDNFSRFVGASYAYDFREVRVWREGEVCDAQDRCVEGRFVSIFLAEDERWERALNSWLLMSTVPAAGAAAIAYAGFRWGNRQAAMVVASVRLSGQRDTTIRTVILIVTVSIPVATIIYLARYGAGFTP